MAENIGMDYIESPTKRRVDTAMALFLGGVASPLAAGVALETMVENKTFNPFFAQPRPGRNERQFNMYKFRTLWKAVQVAEPFSGAKDPRASAVAHLWRDMGLDELPQLWNALVGDISVVGFRPICGEHRQQAASYIADKSIVERYDAGTAAVPGIVGRRELFTKNHPVHTPEVIAKGIELGVGYLENASLREDLCIMVGTANVLGRIIYQDGRHLTRLGFNKLRTPTGQAVPVQPALPQVPESILPVDSLTLVGTI